MSREEQLEETYFQWLMMDAFSNPNDRILFEGVMREMHSIPFYWKLWADQNRAGDALAFRQSDFLQFQDQRDLDRMDQHWLGNWATASPSVLEVLIGMARRWSFYYDQPVPFYFAVLFGNLGFQRVPGKILSANTREGIRRILDNWMSRQFPPDGTGTPFPIMNALHLPMFDMAEIDIWGQMNMYSAEHFQ